MKNGNNTITIANVGDIHLGHPETPTSHIITNLDRYLSNKILDDIDLLTIAGDVYHKLLSFNDPDVALIEEWITRLLYRCAERNVVIRVVEGTPSHDRNQSSFFVRQAAMSSIPVDVGYFDKVAIERIHSLGITMLYVPDIAYADMSTLEDEIRRLLLDNRIEKVDVALMHGCFSFQLPYISDQPVHREEFYDEIVRSIILIGHVHTSTPKGRIIPSGSFDRLKHKEEEAKGFHVIKINTMSDDFTSVFHENKGAKIYLTVDVRGMSEEDMWTKIQSLVCTYPTGSAFSLLADKTDSITKAIAVLRKKYGEFKWTVAIDKTESKMSEELKKVMGCSKVVLNPLTPDVIKSTLADIMREQGVQPDQIPMALELMEREIA